MVLVVLVQLGLHNREECKTIRILSEDGLFILFFHYNRNILTRFTITDRKY